MKPSSLPKWPEPLEEEEEEGINTHQATKLYYDGKYLGELTIKSMEYMVSIDGYPEVSITGYLREPRA